MNNSEKYIPKVGEKCILIHVKNSLSEILILAETDAEFWIQFLDDKRTTVVSKYGRKFRPIPTKADVERKKLVDILCVTTDCVLVGVAKEIQKAGFTIPKKIKRSKIRARLCESLESLHFISVETATDEMVNFLGDLVEDEA